MTDIRGPRAPSPDTPLLGASTGSWELTRLTRTSRIAIAGFLAVLVPLALVPYAFGPAQQNMLTTIFLFIAMASLWNLIAGYAGVISLGQQAFLGVGAYTTLVLVRAGMDPFLTIPFGAVTAFLIAIPLSLALFRTRGAYFAIASWVAAEAFRLFVLTVPAVGGGEGASMPPMDYDRILRGAMTYWAALIVTVAALVGTWLLLRSRLGLDAAAVRDDEVAAFSLGVSVDRARRIPYLVSSAGFGAVGAVIFISDLRLVPASIFSVNYSAHAFFMTLIGGIGTIEGPIIGALIFYALQHYLADWGSWYLVILGALAIVVMMVIPQGLWGWFSRRFDVVLFPIGYRLRASGAQRRADPSSSGAEEAAS
jgi:branched-chain amino acid transport system permease protein